jgi:hypothetical protein
MSDVQHTADLQALLARLTRKGARLTVVSGSATIVVPGQKRARDGDRADLVPLMLVEAAANLGWIVACGTDVYRLTEAGALALRRGAPATVARPAAPSPITAPQPARSGSLTPLARLRQKRDGRGAPILSSVQVEAGERLARDFIVGQMMPRTTANWDRAKLGFAAERRHGSAAGGAIHDGAAAAQERVRRALDDAGPEFAGLLIDVCCLEIGMEAIEQQRQWPPRTARVVLGLGLERLVRHYGMVATGPQRSRPAHWGDATYRPTLARWQADDAGATATTRNDE